MGIGIARLDERGRITLPKDIRRQIRAREFTVVKAGHTIMLHPLEKDSLRHWQEAWRGVTFKSLKEEKQEIREAIQRELTRGHNVR